MKHARKSIALTALVCALGLGLTGCGGDGGDNGSDTPTPTPSVRTAAEGMWCDNDYQDTVVIFRDDGKFWLWSGGGSCGSGFTSLWSTTHGTYTTNGNNFSGSDKTFNYEESEIQSETFTGTAVAKNTLHARSSEDLDTDPGANFIYMSTYDQPASLDSLAGSYTGKAATMAVGYAYQKTGVVISGSDLSMPEDASGCSAQGTVKPHGSVNMFDLSITFKGASCWLGDGTTAKGIAVQIGGSDQIQIQAVTDDGLKDFSFVGSQQ